MNNTDASIADFLKFTVKHLLCASELLLDKDGRTRASNFILSSHFILNEITNELSRMEQRIRIQDAIDKSRNDYLRVLNMEKEWADDVREDVTDEKEIQTPSDIPKKRG